MNIRVYQDKDKEACLSIIKSNYPLYFTEEELAPFESWLSYMPKAEPAYKNSEANYYYVIEEDNTITGCAGFYKVKDEEEVRFAWGMIARTEHGKGYGTALSDYRKEIIKSLYPNSKITLGTSQHTYQFFEKMGFKTTDMIKDGYGKGMDRYDMEEIHL